MLKIQVHDLHTINQRDESTAVSPITGWLKIEIRGDLFFDGHIQFMNHPVRWLVAQFQGQKRKLFETKESFFGAISTWI